MATEQTTVQTISDAICSKLGKVLAGALDKARDSGNMLADFVAECVGAKLPTPVPEDVVERTIVAAYPDGAYDADTLKVRRSEGRNVIRAHATLPEGLTALKAARGKTTYSDTIKLARRLADGEAPAAAVAAMTAPGSAGDPDKRLAVAFRSSHKHWTAKVARKDASKAERAAKLKALDEAAKILGIDLTAKK